MGNSLINSQVLNLFDISYKKKIFLQKQQEKQYINEQDLKNLFQDSSNNKKIPSNLNNLKKLEQKYGTECFYGKFIQEIGNFAFSSESSNQNDFKILKQFENNVLKITRKQCCQLISLMMLQAINQTTSKTNGRLNFDIILETDNNIQRNNANFGKLECIFNYILMMSEQKNNKKFMDEEIEIQRNCVKQLPTNMDIKMQEVQIDTKNGIEYYQKYAQTDFANKYIGGGTLGNGSVQEEIMFAACPELIVSIIFAEVMKDNESLVFRNILKYSNYMGYSQSFKFAGQNKNYLLPQEIVAIDSVNYFKNQREQYTKKFIDREILKSYSGFSNTQSDTIATGNWGCGVFKSDPQLKFLIQWLSCSLSYKKMIYCTFGENNLKDVDQIINQLQNQSIKNVSQMIYNINVKNGSVFEQILQQKGKDNQQQQQQQQQSFNKQNL